MKCSRIWHLKGYWEIVDFIFVLRYKKYSEECLVVWNFKQSISFLCNRVEHCEMIKTLCKWVLIFFCLIFFWICFSFYNYQKNFPNGKLFPWMSILNIVVLLFRLTECLILDDGMQFKICHESNLTRRWFFLSSQ